MPQQSQFFQRGMIPPFPFSKVKKRGMKTASTSTHLLMLRWLQKWTCLKNSPNVLSSGENWVSLLKTICLKGFFYYSFMDTNFSLVDFANRNVKSYDFQMTWRYQKSCNISFHYERKWQFTSNLQLSEVTRFFTTNKHGEKTASATCSVFEKIRLQLTMPSWYYNAYMHRKKKLHLHYW